MGLVFAIMAGYISCRKTEKLAENLPKVQESFFTAHITTDKSVMAVQRYMKNQETKYNFIESLVSRIGMPYWDKALVFQNFGGQSSHRSNSEDSAIMVYIPFVRTQEDFVNAALMVRMKTGDTTFRGLCDWQYGSFGFDTTNNTKWNARDAFNVLATMDKAVFGYTKFDVTDGRIFGRNQTDSLDVTLDSTSSTSARTQQRSNNYSISFICNALTICDREIRGFRSSTSGVNCHTELRCSAIWVAGLDGEDWGWDNEEGSGGGGGTGHGGWLPPTCPVSQSRGTFYNGCRRGWLPNPYYNPVYIDGEWYTTSNYPGKDDGFPWKWWENDSWLSNPNNFNLDLDPDENNQYGKLTAAEKLLVRAHPGIAFAIHTSKTTAVQKTIEKMGVNGLNDKSDAFRHAFFQSLNTVRVGASLTQQFADAHETETPTQLEKEKQMDSLNNSVGIAHGQTLSPIFWNANTIADEIYIKITNGELKYLKPIWAPRFNLNGVEVNPSGDPNFFGTNGTNNPQTATHGITSNTQLTPTNQ